jgi:hypothetical protein
VTLLALCRRPECNEPSQSDLVWRKAIDGANVPMSASGTAGQRRGYRGWVETGQSLKPNERQVSGLMRSGAAILLPANSGQE